jgi:RNA polymerase sigma factor (TIGR02999 family)
MGQEFFCYDFKTSLNVITDSGSQFISLLYHEVRAVARLQLARERPDHTLSATALVNELYLRLARSDQRFADGRDFIPAASGIMRRILVDYARSRNREKRGGGKPDLRLDAIYFDIPAGSPVDIELLDEALTSLAAISERQARVVELRFFGGLDVEETATALGVSSKTVKRDWAMARAWLRSRLSGED